ncbi:Importin alpha subunit (Karyopherin alpha subunit) (Serine-rich RNA polymerase I suppressor protein) [Tulasnella sp. UAMH 9824]|nr:Importin alpha subunit (Karyopherin alpha subunit) (Serine-rich RNA polymerase I suppressor protein) [Tulasnella sp. UAMH 9824]
MSLNTEDTAADHVESQSVRDGDEGEVVDESVLDGYLTDNNRIAPEIVQGLSSDDRNAQREAATKLRQLVDHRETVAIQAIIDSDLHQSITKMMRSEDVELQGRAIRIVAVITSGSSEQTSAVVDEGALPMLIGLASSAQSDDIRDNALLALGNVSADSQRLRTRLIQEGGLKPPLDILADPSAYPNHTVYRAANAISCYSHSREAYPLEFEVTERMISVLCTYILYQQDEAAESLQECLHGLHHIFEDEDSVDKARETAVGLSPRLVHLCTSQEAETRHHALLCVNRVLIYDVDRGQDLINAGILDILKTYIASEDGRNRSDACFVTSNMGLDTLTHAEVLIKSGLVPLLVRVLSDQGDTSGARVHAAWTLSTQAINWGQDRHEILDALLEADCLEAFCSALTFDDYDAVEISLQGIFVLVKTKWAGQQRAVERVKAGDGIKQLRAIVNMSSNPEDPAMENSTNHSDRDGDDKEEQIDESVLDGYTTDDNQLAPEIMEGLRSNDPNAHREAAIRIVAVITESGDSEHVSAPIEAGALPKLIGLASSTKSDETRDYVFIVLGNFGGHSHELGTKLVEEGGLKPMLDVLDNTSPDATSHRYQAAYALSSYAHTNEGKMPEHEVARIIPVLSKYILYQQDETAGSLQESLHSLQHILQDEDTVDKARCGTNLIPRLARLCTSQDTDTRYQAHQCVSQIIFHSVDGVEDLINAGILDAFKTCIASEDGEERRNTCFATSNLVVDKLQYAKALIESGLVPPLIKVLLDQGDDSDARKYAAWTLSNLATNWGQDHHEILDTLLEVSALEAFFSGLTLKDFGAVEASLNGIQVLVETQWEGRQHTVERVKAGAGIEKLRAVRFRNDIHGTELHKTAQTILTDYFPEFSLPARI